MKYIKIALVVLLILLIAILILIFSIKNSKTIPEGGFETGIDYVVEVNNEYQEVTNRNDYYIVKTCVNKFFEYCNLIQDAGSGYYIIDEAVEQTIKQEKQENAKAIYSMLDNKYISEKGITTENILLKLNISNSVNIDIINMYVSEQTETMNIYFVDGIARDKKNNQLKEFSIMVKIDTKNRTFSLFLQDYLEENFNNLNIGDKVTIETENSITENSYNEYDFEAIDDETYIIDLFNKFKEEIIYNQNLVYNNLNEEYRSKRFSTQDIFKTYAKNNVKNHIMMKLSSYKKTVDENVTRFVCIDQNGDYYIFEETAVMKYKAILDTYTVDLPEFIEKYDSGDDKVKLQLNIGKVIEAIDKKDYQYVYNKLDETFRNNNFSNITTFKNFIKENFYDKNEINDGTYRQEGSVHIFTLYIKDKEDENAGTKHVTMLVKLLENRDFVISFSI